MGDFGDILAGLLPTLTGAVGTAIGGPLGGAVGGALGSLGQMGIGALQDDSGVPVATRVDPQPEAPASQASGLRVSPIRPETLPAPNPLSAPQTIQQQNQLGNIPPQLSDDRFDLERAQRIELMQQLLRDLRNG